MGKPSWPSTLIALGFLALVGVMFWKAVDSNFAEVWAGVGTIVGVITGVIPGYFFATQARDSEQQARKKADALQQAATPDVVSEARKLAPEAFL